MHLSNLTNSTQVLSIFAAKVTEYMEKIKIGISIGDINGIGPEVIIKTLADEGLLKYCVPVIYGSSKVISYHKNIVKADTFNFSSQTDATRLNSNKVNVVNCWNDQVNITLGSITEDGGKFAYIALDRAVNDLKNGLIDALVTAPISKEAMKLANFPYPGHTEYLAKEMDAKDHLMMMVRSSMKVAVATGHMALRDVATHFSKDLLERKLKVLMKSLKVDFGKDKPMVALLGLNPHASDNGIMGIEEEEIIKPLIIESKKSGDLVTGPYPADGFFGASMYKKFDAVLAMYHDQGLIPFKALTFSQGVNYSAGLPFVRTSPDHGTAFNIAGKNEADPGSFRAALFLAIDVVRNRKEYHDARANSLQKQP